MSSEAVCRLCLGVDVRMLSLVPLQDVYEKVTNHRLHAKKPVTACYICIAELKRCHRFIIKSANAEATLEELLKKDTDVTSKSVAEVDRKSRGLCHSLAVTPVKREGFDSEYLVVVKSEPLVEEELHLKEEGDPLTEDMAVSDAEDDNSEDDDIPLGSIQQEKHQGEPGSSQAADVASDGEQPPLPLEVNIKVEDNDSDDDATKCTEKQGAKPGGTHIGPEKTYEKQDEGYKTQTSFGLLKIRTVKGYECTICHRRFNKNGVLKNHLRTHTGEKPYACKLCDSKFAQYAALARHMSAHLGKKPNVCSICERRFIVKAELIKHIRTHTGEKPYTCTVCNKSFSLNKHLKCHMKCHTGEKPYECDICHTKFREITHMKRHKSTHTDEKPFECDVCANRFSRRCNLVTHLKIHSGIKDFECETCHAKFFRKTTLKAHMVTHTREKSGKIPVDKKLSKAEKLKLNSVKPLVKKGRR